MTDRTNIDELLANGWEYAGHIGVDAGLCMIGDPCYGGEKNYPNPRDDEAWTKFCASLGRDYPIVKSLNFDLGHEGLGVVVSSGFGDGIYPVLVRKQEVPGWGLRVVEARVLFDFASDEDEEDGDGE